MKKILRPKSLPIIVSAASLLGFLLRLWTIGTGPDKNGLYEPQPIAWVLLWMLTALTLGAILLVSARLKNPGRYTDNFPASLPGAIGSLLMAFNFMITGLQILLSAANVLSSVTGILGVVSAVFMMLTAFARYRGAKPIFLFHALPCLYLALLIFDRCRDWSNQPQIGVFLFQFLASICAMLATYQLATFDVDLGNRRHSLFWSLAGTYFSIISLASGEDLLFYGGIAIWLMTNLCSLRLLNKRKPQPEAPQDTPAPEDTPAESPLEEDMSLDDLMKWLDNQ